MGKERDNKDKRQDWVLRGFRRSDASVCVIITYDCVLDGSDDTPLDCGAVATALVNAAWTRGLGAVINSRGIMQSPVVREHAGIADGQIAGCSKLYAAITAKTNSRQKSLSPLTHRLAMAS